MKEAYEIVIIGDRGVGKTTLVNAYLGPDFGKDGTQRDTRYYEKNAPIPGSEVTLHLVDIWANSAVYLTPGGDGALLCFDCTEMESLKSAVARLKTLRERGYQEEIVLVGAKSDKGNSIATETVRQDMGIGSDAYTYVETSAEKGVNINAAFEVIAQQCANRSKAGRVAALPPERKAGVSPKMMSRVEEILRRPRPMNRVEEILNAPPEQESRGF